MTDSAFRTCLQTDLKPYEQAAQVMNNLDWYKRHSLPQDLPGQLVMAYGMLAEAYTVHFYPGPQPAEELTLNLLAPEIYTRHLPQFVQKACQAWSAKVAEKAIDLAAQHVIFMDALQQAAQRYLWAFAPAYQVRR